MNTLYKNISESDVVISHDMTSDRSPRSSQPPDNPKPANNTRVMSGAIEVQDLHVSYTVKKKRVEAVQGLSFEVQEGEVVGFLGPNGAGKSSTIKSLMGFVTPSQGQCRIFGEPAGEPSTKAKVGYLPEVALYYPFLTPRETLTIFGELQGIYGKSLKDEIDQLLDTVGLKQAKGKQNRQLSKGMLQRVGIAQSLLGNPSLLILDEMTSGLDPIGRQELRNLLQEKRKQGTTMFFSSHELAEVEMLCDRILVLHQGRVVDERILSDLMNDLRQYAVVYRGEPNLLDLQPDWRELDPQKKSARFTNKANLLAAIDRIQKAKGEVLDVTAHEGSLEDYFVDTIRRAA